MCVSGKIQEEKKLPQVRNRQYCWTAKQKEQRQRETHGPLQYTQQVDARTEYAWRRAGFVTFTLETAPPHEHNTRTTNQLHYYCGKPSKISYHISEESNRINWAPKATEQDQGNKAAHRIHYNQLTNRSRRRDST